MGDIAKLFPYRDSNGRLTFRGKTGCDDKLTLFYPYRDATGKMMLRGKGPDGCILLGWPYRDTSGQLMARTRCGLPADWTCLDLIYLRGWDHSWVITPSNDGARVFTTCRDLDFYYSLMANCCQNFNGDPEGASISLDFGLEISPYRCYYFDPVVSPDTGWPALYIPVLDCGTHTVGYRAGYNHMSSTEGYDILSTSYMFFSKVSDNQIRWFVMLSLPIGAKEGTNYAWYSSRLTYRSAIVDFTVGPHQVITWEKYRVPDGRACGSMPISATPYYSWDFVDLWPSSIVVTEP